MAAGAQQVSVRTQHVKLFRAKNDVAIRAEE
jgi:hypothetical protein